MVLANRCHVRVFGRGRGSTASAWSQASLQQVLFKVVVLLVVRGPGNPLESQLSRPIWYTKSGADGRIRTGDPLFTNQDLERPIHAVTYQQVPFCIRPPEISCR